jgi:transcriptional antiterminator
MSLRTILSNLEDIQSWIEEYGDDLENHLKIDLAEAKASQLYEMFSAAAEAEQEARDAEEEEEEEDSDDEG